MGSFDLEQSRFKLNPQYRLQWEEAQTCHVILYPEGLVQLSESAAAILQHCVELTSLAKIVKALETQFPDATDIAEDIKEFLLEAQSQDWVVEEKSASGE